MGIDQEAHSRVVLIFFSSRNARVSWSLRKNIDFFQTERNLRGGMAVKKPEAQASDNNLLVFIQQWEGRSTEWPSFFCALFRMLVPPA
jgi:hypothetical protein